MKVLKIKGKDLFIHKGSEPCIKITDLQNASVYRAGITAVILMAFEKRNLI